MRLDNLVMERTALLPNAKIAAARADIADVRIRPFYMGNGFGPVELAVPISRTKYTASIPANQQIFMDTVITSTKPTVVLLSFESTYSGTVDWVNYSALYINGVLRANARGGPNKRQTGLRNMQLFWPFTPTTSDLNKRLRFSINGSFFSGMNHAVWEVR